MVRQRRVAMPTRSEDKDNNCHNEGLLHNIRGSARRYKLRLLGSVAIVVIVFIFCSRWNNDVGGEGADKNDTKSMTDLLSNAELINSTGGSSEGIVESNADQASSTNVDAIAHVSKDEDIKQDTQSSVVNDQSSSSNDGSGTIDHVKVVSEDIGRHAMAQKYPAIARVGQQIKDVFSGRNPSCIVNKDNAFDVKCTWPHSGCTLREAGKDFGMHTFCDNLVPDEGCTIVSYGLGEASFEEDMMAKGCRGLAMDPTSPIPSQLRGEGKSIKFKPFGAPSNQKPPQWWQMINKRTMWPVLSPQAALRKVGGEKADLSILKMDCEGCEYSIPENVRLEDPDFFNRVGQFVLETHVDERFLESESDLVAYEELFTLLEQGGLKLQHAHLASCGENTGGNLNKLAAKWNMTQDQVAADIRAPQELHYKCIKELEAAGYPCELTCHNFVFARV